MKVFCISDLHLSLTCNKPMNIFGPVWSGYWEKICADWQKKVTNDDIVLISGDISWAMKLEDAICDIKEIICKFTNIILFKSILLSFW